MERAVAELEVEGVSAPRMLIGLAFAWAYELTPEGLKRDRDVSPEQSAAHVTAHKLDKVTIGLLIIVLLIVGAERFDGLEAAPATRNALIRLRVPDATAISKPA